MQVLSRKQAASMVLSHREIFKSRIDDDTYNVAQLALALKNGERSAFMLDHGTTVLVLRFLDDVEGLKGASVLIDLYVSFYSQPGVVLRNVSNVIVAARTVEARNIVFRTVKPGIRKIGERLGFKTLHECDSEVHMYIEVDELAKMENLQEVA